MKPARFVTLCFLYSGTVLLVSHWFRYGLELGVEPVVQIAISLAILLTGVARLRDPDIEDEPTEYGLFAFLLALLSVGSTVILLTELGLL